MKNYLEKIKNNKSVLIGGLIIGLFFGSVFSHKLGVHVVSNNCNSKLKFVRPDLDCNTFDTKAENMSALQDKLRVVTGGYRRGGKADRVSVFVRDLNSSRFVGVNDNDVFYLASLLKTPIMIGGYKLAEVEPKILDQQIMYNGKPNLYDEQIIKPDQVLKVGESYSVRELMKRSVIYSDNTAAQILFDYYPRDFMDRIMQATGLQLTKPTGETENLITARTYAGMFRLLYNASYLTKEYSDEALNVLSQTDFKDGAVAKLPKGVTVAHKFAERTFNDPNSPGKELRQLHECGVVYAKNNPYTFCIMTEGNNYKNLEEIISDVSLIIYNEMIIKV